MLAYCKISVSSPSSPIIPEAYAKIYSSATSHDALLQAEYEAFETGHDELGYTLLKRWNLPSYVAIACMTSHNQSSSQKGEPTIADCVAASGYIADYFLNPSDTEKIAQTMIKLYARLNLDGQALLKVIAKIKDELRTIEELFEFSICSESELNVSLISVNLFQDETYLIFKLGKVSLYKEVVVIFIYLI